MKEILITSSVLIVVLLLLRLAFAQKVSRRLIYGAWVLVALRLLIPVQIGQLDFSVLTAAAPVTEAITEVADKQVAGVTEQDAYREIIRDYVEKDQSVFTPEVQEQIQSAIRDDMSKEEIAVMIDKVYSEQEIFVPEAQQQVQQQVQQTAQPITLGQIAMVVWLAGVAVMAVWFAILNLRHGRILKKNRQKMDADSPIPVYISDRVGTPCLVGLVRPAVYLTPESAEDPVVCRHVLTHEVTHYRHKDHMWSLVRCVCLCVYWFHPLVWVAAWFSRRDCELACDEGALKRLGEGERIAYGKSLLDVVSRASRPADLMQTATAMNETKKQLKERVNFIVRKRKISLLAGVAMVLVCAIITGCVATGAKNSENSKPPSEILQIQEDAVKYFSTKDDTCKPEDVELRLISQFDDTYVMFVDMPFLGYMAAIEEETICELEFVYPSSQRMYVYKNGIFTLLKDAFETGMLTQTQIQEVWEDYRNYQNLPPQTDVQPTTTQPVNPTEPDDGTRIVQLMTKGGWPVKNTYIYVYADETLTQQLETIRTDEAGVAVYAGEAGATYYMVANDYYMKADGFVPAPYYVVKNKVTELLVETQLKGSSYKEVGEIMCEVDCQDRNGNHFLLSEKIAEGKTCLIWCADWRQGTKVPKLMLQLQQVYELFGKKVEILLYTSYESAPVMRKLAAEAGITFPVASAGYYNPDWFFHNGILVVDRYGLLAMKASVTYVDETLVEAIVSYFLDDHYRQERVFADWREFLAYMESLQSAQK